MNSSPRQIAPPSPGASAPHTNIPALAAHHRNTVKISIAILLCLSLASTANAQSSTTPTAPPPPASWTSPASGASIPLTISAQKTARPALEFTLLPKIEDTEKGNAATKYAQAFAELPDLKPEERIYLDAAAHNAPLADLLESDPVLARIHGSSSRLLLFLRQGSRLESADWESNVRREGGSAYLPSLAKARLAATILQLEIRLAIKRHDWPAARDQLQTGYMLAIHCGQGETIIESLVGLAIASTMNRCVEDWIAQPGSPNLYWPLSNLPNPFNDLHRGLTFERALPYFSLPELREMKAGHFTKELWFSLLQRIQTIASSSGGSLSSNAILNPDIAQLAGTAYAVVLYPHAKHYLEARGYTHDNVEKMPVAEVIGRYFLRSFEEINDEEFKWSGLPINEASKGMQATEKEFLSHDNPDNENLLANILLPSLTRARTVAARTDRQLAMLRIIEALRNYAADKGALPNKLEDLSLPIPKNPLTDQPFTWQLTPTGAKLIAPPIDNNDNATYELTLKK